MKVTGIGPTMGVQPTPDHDEQELEIANLISDDVTPLEDPGNAANSSDQSETQEGLARLFDFLKAKNARQEALKKGPKTPRSIALDAYHKILGGELQARGQTFMRRA